MKTSKLLAQGLLKMLSGMLIVGLVLFLPAGSWNYFNGWLFCGLLFLPMLVLGALLLWKAPALLEKRLNTKEQEKAQMAVVAVSSLLFLAAFVAAGLDFRFGWTHVPIWLVCLAAVLQLAAYGLYAEVMRENAWLSRTVEVQENQKVIDTGLYGIIRHPMYTATILLFLAMPLVLGSWVSFAIMLLYPVVIVFRIRNEEQVLETRLAGYREYKQRVRCRLLPFIW
ncbi:MAG: isoprenylcysteine carboxylmethyltransferase family protein [Candidatus Limivicinus sp.]|nr:isoprenylcysteine carboxylmethyltransferase family protein [Candidatus Limivicinus sp.]